MLPAMTPVSIKKTQKLEGMYMIAIRLISYLLPDFSLFRYLALKRYGSVTRTSRTKVRF